MGTAITPGYAQVMYQQEKLMLAASQWDAVLLRLFLDTCETGVKKCIQRENVAPQPSQYRTPRFAQQNPILSPGKFVTADNTRLVALFETDIVLNNLQNIITGESRNGYKPSIGTVHQWVKPNPVMLSKLIVALGTASSSRFMYVGQEIPLINWIKKQPDNSVTIEQLFRHSYRLNKGNVYLSLLTIENVLSDATFEKDRENTLVNRKLTDLYANSPNKFGDWYHFFGTALAGYAQEPAKAIAELYSVYRQISRGKDAEKSTMDADKSGAVLGTRLRNFTEKEVNGRIHFWIKYLTKNTRTNTGDSGR